MRGRRCPGPRLLRRPDPAAGGPGQRHDLRVLGVQPRSRRRSSQAPTARSAGRRRIEPCSDNSRLLPHRPNHRRRPPDRPPRASCVRSSPCCWPTSALSVLLTITVLIARHSVVAAPAGPPAHHRPGPARRPAPQRPRPASGAGWSATSCSASSHVFLVRALFRGRRWAYRRVILLGALGIVGLLLVQLDAYPAWMRPSS